MIVGQQTRRRRNRRWEELDKRSIPLEQLIRHYDVYNSSEGKSSRTVPWYTDCLTKFARFLQNRGSPVNLADTGIEEAREFILYLQQKRKWDDSDTIRTRDENLSPYTIQGYVRSLRLSLYGYPDSTDGSRLGADIPVYRHQDIQQVG